jgi:hypothetical protein
VLFAEGQIWNLQLQVRCGGNVAPPDVLSESGQFGKITSDQER